MLRTDALDYDLPQAMIATHPARPRDAARMMVVRRAGEAAAAEHRHVRDLPDYLRPGDLLVLNTTRVLRARFRGIREDSGGKVDGLYVAPAPPSPPTPLAIPTASDAPAPRWIVLLKSRRTKPGIFIRIHDRDDRPTGLRLRLIERHHETVPSAAAPAAHPADPDSGGWIAELLGAPPGAEAPDILEHIGLTPLPPYIRQARKAAHDDSNDDEDRRDYQTVFATSPSQREGAGGWANSDSPSQREGAGGWVSLPPHPPSDIPHPTSDGSVAAPTAGLHFTPDLLARLEARGIRTASVTLHVGLGTFKPVETEFVEQHPIHSEWCEIPPETGRAIEETRRAGGRIIAVGTTAARTVESFPEDITHGARGWTRLLITPGYQWRRLDGLLTNFHLPRSTLMAMVAAMLGEDEHAVERLKACYAEAMQQGYRFYSFGDAMLIIP